MTGLVAKPVKDAWSSGLRGFDVGGGLGERQVILLGFYFTSPSSVEVALIRSSPVGTENEDVPTRYPLTPINRY